MSNGETGQISTITRAEVRVVAGRHPFEIAHTDAIQRHWLDQVGKNPSLFNGGFFLTTEVASGNGEFSATYQQTDYASFLFWRDHPRLQAEYCHVFPVALITGDDNRVIYGRMAKHTAGSGKIYPPAGSIGPEDVVNGMVDLVGNMIREVREETGLVLSTDQAADCWIKIELPGFVALLKRFHLPHSSEEVSAQIRANLPSLAEQELDQVYTFGPGEVHPDMTEFFRIFQQRAESRL
jgi:8-oxo-dGTP pyrophosphatase MutT (NUDIX family)